jgi:hypothetical protein
METGDKVVAGALIFIALVAIGIGGATSLDLRSRHEKKPYRTSRQPSKFTGSPGYAAHTSDRETFSEARTW